PSDRRSMPKRCAWLSVFFLACAAFAHADPRHVRIAWNVNTGATCATVGTISDATFILPPGWPCMGARELKAEQDTCGNWCVPIRGLVQKGDYVTVYAYAYNPVSYKPLAPVVTVVKPEEPVGITMLTAILAAAGYG